MKVTFVWTSIALSVFAASCRVPLAPSNSRAKMSDFSLSRNEFKLKFQLATDGTLSYAETDSTPDISTIAVPVDTVTSRVFATITDPSIGLGQVTFRDVKAIVNPAVPGGPPIECQVKGSGITPTSSLRFTCTSDLPTASNGGNNPTPAPLPAPEENKPDSATDGKTCRCHAISSGSEHEITLPIAADETCTGKEEAEVVVSGKAYRILYCEQN